MEEDRLLKAIINVPVLKEGIKKIVNNPCPTLGGFETLRPWRLCGELFFSDSFG